MANLLEKASILITPTAYSDGKIHSAKPIEATADLNFTRGSAGTRVNAQGLVENVDTLGSEAVSNGNFVTDSDWVKGSGWNISDGKLNSYLATSNTYQNNNLVSGKIYEVTYTISNYQNGNVRIKLGGTLGLVRNSNGTFTETITASQVYTWLVGSAFTASIDNVSVKEIIDVTNIPRINYKDGVGSWLIEPQSTNLVEYSESFDNGYWVKSGATVTSGFSAPSVDSPLGAFKLVEGSGNSQHKIDPSNISVTNGNSYTSSIFAKKGSRDFIQMVWSGSFGAAFVNFNLTNGTLSESGGAIGKMKLIGDFYRCSITQSALADGLGRCQILIQDSMSANRFGGYQGDGTSGVYIFGTQSEQLSYATSYIKTEGSTQTRLAETASRSGLGDLIDSTQGVFYAEISAFKSPVSSPLNITLSDGTANNYIRIELYQDGKVYGNVYDGSSVAESFTVNQENINKIALMFSENTCKLYLNGIGVGFNGKNFSSNTLNTFSFSSANGLNSFFYGNIKSLAVYPILTDEELECLTTR